MAASLPGKTPKKLPEIPQRVSITARSGLVLSVPRAVRRLRVNLSKDMRVSITAGVYLASVTEYLIAEIVEEAGRVCHEQKKKIITPHHINLAVREDQDLDNLMKPVIISGGGVVPFIPAEALKRLKRKVKTVKPNEDKPPKLDRQVPKKGSLTFHDAKNHH